jgi:hypothetical protein
VTRTRPPPNSDNVDGLFMFVTSSTFQIHIPESAKALAKVNQFLPKMGLNERNQGQIAGLRG